MLRWRINSPSKSPWLGSGGACALAVLSALLGVQDARGSILQQNVLASQTLLDAQGATASVGAATSGSRSSSAAQRLIRDHQREQLELRAAFASQSGQTSSSTSRDSSGPGSAPMALLPQAKLFPAVVSWPVVVGGMATVPTPPVSTLLRPPRG
ncbi:MAG: hypothetical protein IT424_09595 [Pirellulales bacterium]|nr:hypothetical protein [Pirellulales bacterium]